jgi:tetratricopeptide (TPR) repeat protein
LAQDRGDLAAAAANFAATAEMAKSAASSTGDKGAQQQALSASATSLCLLGRVRELQGDVPGAKHAYSAAMELPGFAGDPYPSLATANLAFRDVYSVEEGAREPILRACFDAFKDVLKRFPHSLYAANGLGMILAEQGRLEAAQDVFAHAREANPEALQPTVNLALTQVALGNTSSALQLFAHAQRKAIAAPTAAASSGMSAAGGGSAVDDAASAEHVRLLSYEARAHMEARSFGSALVALARAASLSPHDMRVKYNLSFAQAEDALRVLGTDPSQRTAAQVESAVENLRCAARGFQWLQSTLESLQRGLAAAEEEMAATKAAGAASPASAAQEHRAARLRARIAALGVPRERVATFVAHVQGTLPAAEAHLADARLRASKATAEAAERAAFLTARAAAKAGEEAAAAAETDRKREAARAAARQLQNLLQELPQAGTDGAGAAPAADTDDGVVGGKRKKKAVKPRGNGKRRRVGEDDTGARAASPGGSSISSSSSSSSSDSDSDSDSSSGSESSSSPDRSAAAVRAVFGDDAEEMASEAKESRGEAVTTGTIEDLFGAEED